MKKYILAAFSSLLLLSCKTQPSVEKKPVDVKAPVSSSAFISTVTKKSGFNQVKINSKVDVQTGNFIPTIDATIYIENGNKVWMNMTAVLFNVARGIATPSGIKGYEKWNKTYIESDFTYLNNLLNVNFLNYNSFQNLLTAKTFVPVNEQDFVLNKNMQGYALNSSKNQKVTVNGKTTEYKINLDYASNFDLNKVLLQEINSSNSLEVQYSNWNVFGTERFPQNVKIIIKGEKNGQVLIENTKFDFSTMQTPYSVPSGYTKVNIR
ncbi:DUF4292 domain-containing protein [Chryseobacterium taklimakanense]|uniref:DUF4292 domain-containing protein n=1 Tax=Chryseobacterium taklimakanense TaxID=536441 RepID=UPI001EF3E281|nr:DUF4292 domain-containing protein [Chryseobacterium taklimakanense]MCG7280479.1 DUF4292 domain-containing protein [Chryseobacterium taklimakanense]